MDDPFPKVPVAIICKDRPCYLDLTLRSLSATLPEDIPVYLFDDHSTSPDMLRYLHTNDEFSIEKTDLSGGFNRHWEKYVGPLETVEKLRGVKNKVKLITSDVNLKDIDNSLRAIRESFCDADYPFIFRIEDDVVFRESWYEEMVEIYLNWKRYDNSAGILGGMQAHPRKTFFPKSDITIENIGIKSYSQWADIQNSVITIGDAQYSNIITFQCDESSALHLEEGNRQGVTTLSSLSGISGQCYLFPLDLYLMNPKFFNTRYKMNGCDSVLCRFCWTHGFKVGVMNQAVCQHIGFIGEDKPYLDTTFIAPFRATREVRNFVEI